MSRDPLAENLFGWIARQSERDEDVIADLSGTTEALARERAVRVFGSDSELSAGMTAARLRGSLRRTGTITPDDAAMLVAAEIITDRRTDLGREVEALLPDWY